jgi:hypothetical protein
LLEQWVAQVVVLEMVDQVQVEFHIQALLPPLLLALLVMEAAVVVVQQMELLAALVYQVVVVVMETPQLRLLQPLAVQVAEV